MKRIVLVFGLLAGAVMSAMMFAVLPFSDHGAKGMIVGYTTMVLAMLMIYFGVRSYRDNVAGGSVGFGRALAVGSLIAVVASACYVATWEYIYFNTDFGSHFIESYQASAIESARAKGESEQAIAQKRREMEEFAVQYNNPVINAAYTFLEPLPVAVIIALVTAVVVSRKKKTVLGGDGSPAGQPMAVT